MELASIDATGMQGGAGSASVSEFFHAQCETMRRVLEHSPTERLRGITWCAIPVASILDDPAVEARIAGGQAEGAASGHGFYRLASTPPTTLARTGSVPTVWGVPDLPSQPWWDGAPTGEFLERNFPAIRDEFEQWSAGFVEHPDSSEIVTAGAWRSLFLISAKGSAGAEIAAAFPNTLAAIESLKPCRNFGFAAFFRIDAGTSLARHTGSANMRLRHQLGIKVDPAMQGYLEVGDERRSWSEGRCLVFDDSYPHEVRHLAGGPRVVLAMDTWHPALEPGEIEVLSHPIFTQFGKVAR